MKKFLFVLLVVINTVLSNVEHDSRDANDCITMGRNDFPAYDYCSEEVQ